VLKATLTNTRRGFLVLACLLGAGLAGVLRDARAQTTVLQETQKIEYLISEVQSLNDATFFRNGVGYDGVAAAAHLRLKWHAAGSRVTTAEDFIRRCATGSSVSGLPYTIRFSDGHELTSERFLHRKLRELEALPPIP
jgi:hypothetical protein